MLYLHAGFVLFVVVGLLLVLAGGALGWTWVRNRAFRVCHLIAIGVVALQAWLGVLCPLTQLEMVLRVHGESSTYAGSFIAHWVERFLYYDAPDWVFMLVYTIFGLAVLASWFRVRPYPNRSQ